MLRFPIPAPRSDEGTLVPAVLLGLLIIMMALQFWLARSEETVPAGESLPVRMAYKPPRITAVAVAPAILTQPIFSPTRAAGSGATSGDLLEGSQIIGAWSQGRQARLVLRKPDGNSVTIRLGQVVNGWQLAGITSEGARFARSGDTALIHFGASAPQSQSNDENQSEEEQQ